MWKLKINEFVFTAIKIVPTFKVMYLFVNKNYRKVKLKYAHFLSIPQRGVWIHSDSIVLLHIYSLCVPTLSFPKLHIYALPHILT